MYKAIKDRIIIKLDESVKSNIITMNNGIPDINSGVVVSIGKDVKSVKEGDYIIFHLFDEIALPKGNLAVVREKSVLARFV